MDNKMAQLKIQDDGSIGEEIIEDKLEPEVVDYAKLDKVDLIRLCKEKDSVLNSYETERGNQFDAFNKEIENLNNYYIAKVKELKSLIGYYERKFALIKNLIDIEKEEKKDDTIQRTTKGQA